MAPDEDELLGILRDACRMCGARSATLSVGGAVVAAWPPFDERDGPMIASALFETPAGAHAEFSLFAAEARELTQIQTLVLKAYAAHAQACLP
jgi:hypothetical protein